MDKERLVIDIKLDESNHAKELVCSSKEIGSSVITNIYKHTVSNGIYQISYSEIEYLGGQDETNAKRLE